MPLTRESMALTWENKTTKSMREGLMGLAKGLKLAVRNVATHTRKELTEQEGMEHSALSHPPHQARPDRRRRLVNVLTGR